MHELLEQFLIEGRELVIQGQADLAVLREDPANPHAIDGAFRALHTLKGSVGIFPMAAAERVLHAAETVLSRVRNAPPELAAAIPGLVATLDQIDRWIDAMERDEAIGADADAIADRLIADIPTEPEAETPPAPSDLVPWASILAVREASALADANSPLTAFRYTPDAEAFFRGDDPLQLVATVPDLVTLAVLPVGEAWPDLATIDPFLCTLVIEGVSSAPLADLKAIFRLVPDQIAFHALDSSAAAFGPASVGVATSGQFVRVDTTRLDGLADSVGELAIAVNAFSAVADCAERIDPAIALAIRAAQGELDRAVGVIHRSVATVRRVPLGPALARLPRLAREIAADLGKTISFTIEGDRIEVDKQIADGLFEPLLHLLRNALDHGIERPEVRSAAGKAVEGCLALQIAREGEDVIATLSDDGAGIDPAAIRATALARGLIDADAAQQLTDTAALALIFAPGFSTAQQISEVSGRGVGMDAVQAAVDRMRGRIEIDSTIGKGTRFRLRFPANALTTRLLVIAIGPDRYAVPLEQIAETARLPADRLMPLGLGTACVLRGRTVPVLSLAELLGGSETALDPVRLIVTNVGGEPVALRIDGFGDRIDAMVRAPAGLLAGMPSVAGTALLADGEVLLVLNLAELIA